MGDIAISVADNGRIVLPVALRRRLNVVRGGTLVIREEDGRLVLESADAAITRAQDIVRRFAPDATGVVDELSAERRAEAEREDGMTLAVLDASAVLALLFGETGADAVRPRIRGGLISTVNLAEVLAKLVDKGLPPTKPRGPSTCSAWSPCRCRSSRRSCQPPCDPTTRAAGLSLGDRACLALARERGLPAVTAERRWPEVAEQAGVAVEVIR